MPEVSIFLTEMPFLLLQVIYTSKNFLNRRTCTFNISREMTTRVMIRYVCIPSRQQYPLVRGCRVYGWPGPRGGPSSRRRDGGDLPTTRYPATPRLSLTYPQDNNIRLYEGAECMGGPDHEVWHPVEEKTEETCRQHYTQPHHGFLQLVPPVSLYLLQ